MSGLIVPNKTLCFGSLFVHNALRPQNIFLLSKFTKMLNPWYIFVCVVLLSVDFYIQLHEIAPTNVLAYPFCEIWLQLILSRFKNVVQ